MSQLHLSHPDTRDAAYAALRLLLSEHGAENASLQAETLLAAESEGRISLAGLRTANRDGKLVGASWALVQAGRTALVWPPRLSTDEPNSTGDELLAAVLECLAGSQIRLAQAVLSGESPPATSDSQLLSAHGFFHTADLLYLAVSAESFYSERPSLPCELDCFNSQDSSDVLRLIRLIDRTYEQTCDCPELNGVRETKDVLDGYRATGVFAPERWLIAREGATDLGCLLLADHPAEDQWELVYLGVAPEARGRKLGLALTRLAQWLARESGRARLVLAVDARNAPALIIYEAVGFKHFDRRSVMLRICN